MGSKYRFGTKKKMGVGPNDDRMLTLWLICVSQFFNMCVCDCKFTKLYVGPSAASNARTMFFKRRCELLLPHTPHYLTLSGPSSSFTGNPGCIVHKYGKGVSEQYLLWFMSSLCYVFWHSSTITHAQQEENSPPDAPHLSLIVAIHIQEYATRLFHF